MPTLEAMLSVALAGFALSATPGPSMLYVLSRTVGQSRAAGFASALGLCLGGILLAIATALGLATVFATFDWLVTVLRYLGAAYLIWLGSAMIWGARVQAQADLAVTEVKQNSILAIIWQGVLVELLNPKTVLFFALFLPPFVGLNNGPPDHGSAATELLILGALVPLTAVPSDLIVAMLGGTMTKALDANKRAREVMAWTGGLVLIGIAVSLNWGAA